MKDKLLAEFFGTFWLVFGGCGSAVLAAKFIAMEGATPINLGIGLVGVAFAFGLTVLTMAFAIGHISGCHLNPAVSVGLWVGGRFRGAELLPYILVQLLAGAAGASVSSHGVAKPGFPGRRFCGQWFWRTFARPLFSARRLRLGDRAHLLFPVHHSWRDRRARSSGFCSDCHRFGTNADSPYQNPVTNLSVNPARSTGPALFVGGWALQQLWMFWVALGKCDSGRFDLSADGPQAIELAGV